MLTDKLNKKCVQFFYGKEGCMYPYCKCDNAKTSNMKIEFEENKIKISSVIPVQMDKAATEMIERHLSLVQYDMPSQIPLKLSQALAKIVDVVNHQQEFFIKTAVEDYLKRPICEEDQNRISIVFNPDNIPVGILDKGVRIGGFKWNFEGDRFIMKFDSELPEYNGKLSMKVKMYYANF